MVSSWLAEITYWHWWVLGIAFIILEILSPAAFFLWLGIAAGLVGLLLVALPDLRAGNQVRVSGVDGLVLLVECPTSSDIQSRK